MVARKIMEKAERAGYSGWLRGICQLQHRHRHFSRGWPKNHRCAGLKFRYGDVPAHQEPWKKRLRIFADNMKATFHRQLSLENGIRKALEKGSSSFLPAAD